MEPAGYQGKSDQLIIRVKVTNWLLGQMGPTSHQGKRKNWLLGQKEPTSYHNKRYQLAITIKGTNWLLGQMEPTGYQGKSDQLIIRVKGTNWLVGKRNQLTIGVKGTNNLLGQIGSVLSTHVPQIEYPLAKKVVYMTTRCILPGNTIVLSNCTIVWYKCCSGATMAI